MNWLVFISLFFATNSWACPDKSKRFWVEPQGTLRIEGCLSAEPYAVTFYKLGEVLYSKVINKDSDLKSINSDLAKNKTQLPFSSATFSSS